MENQEYRLTDVLPLISISRREVLREVKAGRIIAYKKKVIKNGFNHFYHHAQRRVWMIAANELMKLPLLKKVG